jgi:hypothetical protein
MLLLLLLLLLLAVWAAAPSVLLLLLLYLPLHRRPSRTPTPHGPPRWPLQGGCCRCLLCRVCHLF